LILYQNNLPLNLLLNKLEEMLLELRMVLLPFIYYARKNKAG